jgi:hypothetical protein
MLNTKLEAALTALGHVSPASGDSFQPLRLEEMSAMESKVGGTLSEDYRLFGSRYGKSSFNNLVGYKLPNKRTIFSSSFYGGGKDTDDVYHINWAIRAYEGRMPSTVIPIAECGEQGEICLCVSGTEYGEVFFWDRKREYTASEEDSQRLSKEELLRIQFQHLTHLTDSFETFLSRLVVVDP